MIEMLTGRPPTLALHGMVACPHALASEAGVEILKAGGSAVDAALATSATLSVIYPHMTGLGGDAFWLIYDAKQHSVRYLDGAGCAAASASIETFRLRGMKEIPFRGILPATLTVPGAVASWCEAHAAHGRLPLARNLAAAVGYAREGFPVTERLANWIAAAAPELAKNREASAIFLKSGGAPHAGQSLVNKDLARSIETLGAGGRDAYYEGEIAKELSRYASANAGLFTEADFRAQHAQWREPISTDYRGVRVYQTPPPTQGIAVLQMLNLIQPFEIAGMEYLGADHVHFLVQAKQLAYHDRDRWIADPNFTNVPVKRLLSRAYADERRALIDPVRALPWDKVPSYGSLTGDTVYICAVDAEGNAASLIQSLYGIFGSCVVAGKSGIVLQNRSAYFSLVPAHPNHLAPGKRPLHTLIASLAFRDDKLWQVFGCMGADGQPQIQLQAYVAMIDFGLNVQQAIESPRWLSGRFTMGEPRNLLNIEGRYPESTLKELERRGHVLNRWGAWTELAGHAHGISIDPVTHTRSGGSDPRSDGAAIGY
jgi:gamma-glutamyltranspeptidase